jgi:hypothetical protein
VCKLQNGVLRWRNIGIDRDGSSGKKDACIWLATNVRTIYARFREKNALASMLLIGDQSFSIVTDSLCYASDQYNGTTT